MYLWVRELDAEQDAYSFLFDELGCPRFANKRIKRNRRNLPARDSAGIRAADYKNSSALSSSCPSTVVNLSSAKVVLGGGGGTCINYNLPVGEYKMTYAEPYSDDESDDSHSEKSSKSETDSESISDSVSDGSSVGTSDSVSSSVSDDDDDDDDAVSDAPSDLDIVFESRDDDAKSEIEIVFVGSNNAQKEVEIVFETQESDDTFIIEEANVEDDVSDSGLTPTKPSKSVESSYIKSCIPFPQTYENNDIASTKVIDSLSSTEPVVKIWRSYSYQRLAARTLNPLTNSTTTNTTTTITNVNNFIIESAPRQHAGRAIRQKIKQYFKNIKQKIIATVNRPSNTDLQHAVTTAN
jgi:hypothetical protein